MNITEKAAYLKGLADGMNLDSSTGEGKLFAAIIDLLGDVADEIEVLNQNDVELSDELDEFNDELNDIAELFDDLYDDEDEDFDDFEDYYDDEDEDYEFNDDDVFYEVKCPTCEEEITIDEATLMSGSVKCPACGEELEFDVPDFDEDEDEE